MMRRVLSSHHASTARRLVVGAVFQHRCQTVPPRRTLHVFDEYLSGSAANFVDDLYSKYQQDPSSVDPSWHSVFESANFTDYGESLLKQPIRVASDETGPAVSQSLADCAKLTWMIQAFEDRGHLLANLDPLNFETEDVTKRAPTRKFKESLRLDLEFFGFKPVDHSKVVRVGFRDDVGGILDTRTQSMTLTQLHEHLTKTYCGNIGYEFSHITNERIVRYLREQVESPERNPNSPIGEVFSPAEKKNYLNSLADAVFFEDYLYRKNGTAKRFGLEGNDSLVLGLRVLTEQLATNGLEELVVGMAHRGRLNSLCNLFGKPLEAVYKEFGGITEEDLLPFKMQFDVKYHLGSRTTMHVGSRNITIELLSNPSHLEAVNPVVQGKTKAAQMNRNDFSGATVCPVEIHGDAAYAGQGVVSETMCISEIGEYHTGGTIHVVTNNQIGFTTDPTSSRTSAYCTDIGRVYQCPIFHVNADCPEDVARVFKLAANYRAEFRKSVVIDLIGYRRNGHNETDDPTMTQPLMYQKIKKTPDVFKLYSKKLIQEGVITEAEVEAVEKAQRKKCSTAANGAADFDYGKFLQESIHPVWRDKKFSDAPGSLEDTKVSVDTMSLVKNALNRYPENFHVHSNLTRILDRRRESLEKGENIEWGTAEALAFGSLLHEGHDVRVSGQDVERGTYSQRHAILHDQTTNENLIQLDVLTKPKHAGRLTITNSALSEFAVLGFETGYSMHNPNGLVMWEAQFGDFANGAQTIFDQFIAASETKWNVPIGVLVSMPQGYDGNGPEHSSGRIERFLQQVNEDECLEALSENERHHRVNWEVTYPSTPAQYFHLLRRLVKRDFRKPCINFFSKQFLRAPNVSTMDDIITGGFQPLIEDPSVPPKKCRKLILCSGQIYHALNRRREQNGIKDVAIARIEQLAPFPVAEMQNLLKSYGKVPVMWVQEEPKNMGPYWHVEARVEHYTQGKRELIFAGRPTSASPASGFKSVHDQEEASILERAFE